MATIAVLGAGKIAEALLSGLLSAKWPRSELTFTGRSTERVADLTTRLGVTASSIATAGQADIVVVAVKPQDIGSALRELAAALAPNALVVSLCAGVPTARLEAELPAGTPVVRAMPNTPMLIGKAMSAISRGRHATDEHLDAAEHLLRSVGAVVRVPESHQDAVTAISGSGPAYFFFLVEAMIDAGVLLGLPRATAAELITQSAQGASVMLHASDPQPASLRESVTSPAGTTITALRELERHGVRAAFFAAIEKARDRSAELGQPAQTVGGEEHGSRP